MDEYKKLRFKYLQRNFDYISKNPNHSIIIIDGFKTRKLTLDDILKSMGKQ